MKCTCFILFQYIYKTFSGKLPFELQKYNGLILSLELQNSKNFCQGSWAQGLCLAPKDFI